MQTFYDAQDDILTLHASDAPIVRETAPDWNTRISYAADGSVVEMVILDASRQGTWPLLRQGPRRGPVDLHGMKNWFIITFFRAGSSGLQQFVAGFCWPVLGVLARKESSGNSSVGRAQPCQG